MSQIYIWRQVTKRTFFEFQNRLATTYIRFCDVCIDAQSRYLSSNDKLKVSEEVVLFQKNIYISRRSCWCRTRFQNFQESKNCIAFIMDSGTSKGKSADNAKKSWNATPSTVWHQWRVLVDMERKLDFALHSFEHLVD